MMGLRFAPVATVAVLSVVLFSCSRTPVSYAPTVNETQAQSGIDARVQKTQSMRGQLSALYGSLKPLEVVLHDLGKEMDLKVDQHPGSVVATMLDRLQRVLGTSIDGIIETHPDGSWFIERLSPLCSSGVVLVTGTQSLAGELITVAHSDCANPLKLSTWATVLVKTDGTREIKLIEPAFANLRGQVSAQSDFCTISLDATGYTDMSCRPMRFVADQSIVLLDSLSFKTDIQGIHAVAQASVLDVLREQLLATASIRVEPGHPPDLRVCTEGPSCAR